MAKRNNVRRKNQPITWETVREFAMTLPESVEGTSYGTPAFRVRGKLFARLHQSGESVVVKIDENERALRMKADLETFYITDHYLKYPLMLVRLATVHLDDLHDLLTESWRRGAPQRLVVAFERARPESGGGMDRGASEK